MRTLASVLLVALLGAAGIASAVREDKSGIAAAASVAPATESGTPLRIIVSGNRAGLFINCPCTGKKGGGVGRESFLKKKLLKDDPRPTLHVDSGAFFGPSNDVRQPIDNLYAVHGMAVLGMHAVNVSTMDLDLGIDSLRAAQKLHDLPFISANTVERETGKPIFPAYREVQLPAGGGKPPLRVAIIGVTDLVPPTYAVGDAFLNAVPGFAPPRVIVSNRPRGFETPPPVERAYLVEKPEPALRKAIEEVRDRNDLVVVLTFLGSRGAQALVNDVPGIDIVVAGVDSDLASLRADRDLSETESGAARMPAWVLAPKERTDGFGEFLCTVVKNGVGEDPVYQGHLLPESAPEDAELFPLMRAYERVMNHSLPTMDKLQEQIQGISELGYAGSETCAACHIDQYKSWKSSAHAHAGVTLRALNELNNPQCASCHTTGYLKAGGFNSTDERVRLAEVGCESCHGPAAEHVMHAFLDWRVRARVGLEERSNEAMGAPAPIPPVARKGLSLNRTDCTTCHTTTYDPGFKFIQNVHRVCATGVPTPEPARPGAGPSAFLKALEKHTGGAKAPAANVPPAPAAPAPKR